VPPDGLPPGVLDQGAQTLPVPPAPADRTRARRRGIRALPAWAQVVLAYGASRVVTTVLILILASVQRPNPWTGAHPGYFDFASIWDGRWYQAVLAAGYPSTLPLDAAGYITQNTWAFLPGYPWTVGAIMAVTGWPWSPAAVLTSLGFGLAAALVFHRLMARLGMNALFATILFCCGPVSPLFQLAYAESLFVFLIVTALLLLSHRRYLGVAVVASAASFVRPGGLAFALLLGLHVLGRWRRRTSEPFPRGEASAAVLATGGVFLAGAAWPVIVGLATGVPGGYAATELSWRAPYIGFQALVPFAPWVQGAAWWARFLQAPVWIGLVTLAAVLALFVLILVLPAVRGLGRDLRLWLVSYSAYLLAVFFPQSSTFRLLMPLFPLAGALASPRGRLYRTGLVVAFLFAQAGWLLLCWGVDGADWSPP
jgi:hypothetical protein